MVLTPAPSPSRSNREGWLLPSPRPSPGGRGGLDSRESGNDGGAGAIHHAPTKNLPLSALWPPRSAGGRVVWAVPLTLFDTIESGGGNDGQHLSPFQWQLP